MYRKDAIVVGEWIRNSNKALLVTGARQTGKTWLIRDEIEKSGYTKFELNFIDQPDMVSYLKMPTLPVVAKKKALFLSGPLPKQWKRWAIKSQPVNT